mmetsp:Transcript_79618/g.179588  ORF Transcript_79618/g.179588 Transcript_79618/m.179588 type:complete len:131 (+) Transcript_79618:3-395(+)
MIQILLPEAASKAWQKAVEEASEAQVLEVAGVAGPNLNGMYDYLDSQFSEGTAPVFQHQVNQEQFLYLAVDGRWHVGSEEAMRERTPDSRSRMHSDVVCPGVLPTLRGLGWHVFNRSSKEWEKQAAVKIS